MAIWTAVARSRETRGEPPLSTGARIITLLLLVGVAVGGWILVRRDGVPDFLRTSRARAEERVRNELAGRIRFEREAKVRVLDRIVDESTGRVRTRVEWTETVRDEEDGDPEAESLVITVEGEKPRFEALIMTFGPERHGPLADRSLVLFRRVYGEHTAPSDGFTFADPANPVPAVYQVVADGSRVERELWVRFWNLATDPEAARAEGIEVLQLKAVSTLLVPGKTYRVTADTAGRMDIRGPFDR